VSDRHLNVSALLVRGFTKDWMDGLQLAFFWLRSQGGKGFQPKLGLMASLMHRVLLNYYASEREQKFFK
jgi:hypothetical protein